jgi:hypothetical protein
MYDWNRLVALRGTSFNDQEVKEFPKLDQQKLSLYQSNPMLAAEKALTRMLSQNIIHDDLKWSHVALLPSFSGSSKKIDLIPILLDLTRTSRAKDSSNLLQKFMSDLSSELQNPR